MDTERLLRELLAVIHGDGGHHAQRHGLEESCRQAHERIAAMRVELDRLRSDKPREDLGVTLLRLSREAAQKEVYARAWEAAILDGATRDQAHQLALDAADKEWPR